MGKMHIKTGDTVVIISGKDKGKKGKVIAAYPKKDRVVVEGLNQVKRHTKPSQNNPQGGIITKEAPFTFPTLCSSTRKAVNRLASEPLFRRTAQKCALP